MNLTRDRVRSIGWMLTFTVALVLLAGLTLRVNAVRSRVLLTERRIAAVERDSQALETEFQTRANQQQLTALNEVEFGYGPPDAGQYVAGQPQLAAYARPSTPAAPAPVLLAAADESAPAPQASVAAAPRVALATPVAERRGGGLAALVAPRADVPLTDTPRTRLLGDGARGSARAPVRIALSDIAPATTPRRGAATPARPATARRAAGPGEVELARAFDAAIAPGARDPAASKGAGE